LETGTAGGACSNAPPSLAAREELQNTGDRECPLPLCLPTPAVSHRHLQNTKKTQATVPFGFIFLRSGSFGSVTVGSASLQIRFLLLQVAGRWTMELLVCGRWLKETAVACCRRSVAVEETEGAEDPLKWRSWVSVGCSRAWRRS